MAKMIESEMPERADTIRLGLVVEGGLLLIALLLGWMGVFDHQQPISSIGWSMWPYSIGWGLIATVPMVVYLIVFHYWTPNFYRPMRKIIDSKLRPMFQNSSYLDLLLLSLMAGFGEELLFRWSLQGGITSIAETTVGTPMAVGIGVGIASLIFGACHWVNRTYAITTAIVGVYFGMTMIWTGTWLVPAISHGVFDFVALIYIVRSKPHEQRSHE